MNTLQKQKIDKRKMEKIGRERMFRVTMEIEVTDRLFLSIAANYSKN